MNKEKEKTAEELAYYVKSDLDIQEIVKGSIPKFV